jgi:putative oxidoreductase
VNRLTPYAAVILRFAVGAVFLSHGIQKWHTGVAGVGNFLHSLGIPFASIFAVALIALETVGAVCLLLGIMTRIFALGFAIDMAVAIPLAVLPHAPELEVLLLAGALALVALGDGPLSIGIRFKKPQ